MPRMIAVANQKGGVAKTTTVHALAAALAERGRSVLCVDLDPQACLTYAAGVDAEALDGSIHDVMMGRAKVADVLWESSGFDLVPSSIDLAGAESRLLTRPGREFVLDRALRPACGDYDYVLVDCPPALGLLTINGLTAASEVLIPLHADTLASRGVGQLLETIADVRRFTNPDLVVLGAVITMHDPRTRLGREVVDEVANLWKVRLLQPAIPRSVRVAESPRLGKSVLEHASTSKAASAYRLLAANLERRRPRSAQGRPHP